MNPLEQTNLTARRVAPADLIRVPVVLQAPKPRRRRTGRSWYALHATRDEILIPQLPRPGYLVRSRLIQEAQAGDVAAWHRVWLLNARLAFSVANRCRLRRDLMADAIQEAQIGLARAIQKFEVDRLNEFTTYAYFWLRQAIHRFRARRAHRIAIPDYSFGAYLGFRRRIVDAVTRNNWFDAREQYLDRKPSLYARLLRIHAIEDAGSIPRRHPKAAEDSSPAFRVLDKERSEQLWKALNGLSVRYRQILIRRFGLAGCQESTLEEIGASFGLTRERIRQLEVKAMDALRQQLIEMKFCEEVPVPDAELADSPDTAPDSDPSLFRPGACQHPPSSQFDAVPSQPQLRLGFADSAYAVALPNADRRGSE